MQKNKNQHTKKKAYVGKKTITAKLFFGKNFRKQYFFMFQ